MVFKTFWDTRDCPETLPFNLVSRKINWKLVIFKHHFTFFKFKILIIFLRDADEYQKNHLIKGFVSVLRDIRQVFPISQFLLEYYNSISKLNDWNIFRFIKPNLPYTYLQVKLCLFAIQTSKAGLKKTVKYAVTFLNYI